MIFFIFMQSRRKNILYHVLRVSPFFYCDFHPHVRFTQHKNGDAKYIRYCLQEQKSVLFMFKFSTISTQLPLSLFFKVIKGHS